MKFGIEKKIIIGYLPVILLIIVIAILSTLSLNELNSINMSIIEEDAFLVLTADKMEDTILAQESYGRRYLILDNRQMLDLFWQRDQEFNDLVDKVRALPNQKDIPIDELASLHNEFNMLYTKHDESLNKHSPLVTGEFDDLVKNKFDKMMVLLQQMHQVGKQNQYKKMEKANNIGIRSFRFTVLLATLGIILGLAATSIITRSISQAIKELKRATQIISEGKYDYSPQVNTKDEMEDLATSLRVMALRLSLLEKKSLDSSPLTRMPGGIAIENIMTKRLEMDKNIAFCLLDLDNFKSYNDRYGYAKGNEVIRAAAAIIQSALAEHGSKDDFVGHIGGDDFAIVTDTTRYDKICKTIIKGFDKNIVYFYNETDRERGHIVSKNRQGHQKTYPIMTVSMAVVTNDQGNPINQIEIGEIAAELKEYAKTIPESVFVTNRRERGPKNLIN